MKFLQLRQKRNHPGGHSMGGLICFFDHVRQQAVNGKTAKTIAPSYNGTPR
jgi:hypothetical protein